MYFWQKSIHWTYIHYGQNCHHYQTSDCFCSNTKNNGIQRNYYLICQLWLLIYVMMLFLTPQYVTENTNVHNKKYQWQSTMTLNLCAQIKYFRDNWSCNSFTVDTLD